MRSVIGKCAAAVLAGCSLTLFTWSPVRAQEANPPPERGMHAGLPDDYTGGEGDDVSLQGDIFKGVDVSSYSGSISVSSFSQMISGGYYACIVQAWGGRGKNARAAEQINNASAAGMWTGAYILLNYDRTDQSAYYQVQQGFNAIGDALYNLSFIAIDAETVPGWAINTDPTARIAAAVEAVSVYASQAGASWVYPVIYTSNYMWSTLTRSTTSLSWVPLWDARYDRVADLFTDNGRAWVPYGGWTYRYGKQYQGTTTLYGKSVDLNVFDSDLFY